MWNGSGRRRLVLILDCMNRMEIRMHQELAHGGGEMLRFLCKRMSLSRESWCHTYCYRGEKEGIPSKKKDRLAFLEESLTQVNQFIIRNKPCIAIGMGKLACEHLTGHSVLKDRAGTCWKTAGYGTVWITQPPDAALFNPDISMHIYGVLFKAAERANLNPKFDPTVKVFDWTPYLKNIKQEAL